MTTLEPAVSGASLVDIEAIRELADLAGTELTWSAEIEHDDGLKHPIPVLIDRRTGAARSVKALYEEWRIRPDRKKGTATVKTLQSFTALTNRHKTSDSVIFADTDWRTPSLTAVIDYHQKEGAAADNGQHRIHYPFPLTEEWKEWLTIHGKPLEQTNFAEFIEDHRAELVAPHEDEVTFWEQMLGGKMAHPNELQMLSRGLKIHASVNASSAVTLATGEGELTWEETHSASRGGQKIVVPSLFMISLPPFYQGEKARIPVRLRYRLPPGGGAVKWIVALYRPDIYVTEQVIRDMERAADETELDTFQGAPEMRGV